MNETLMIIFTGIVSFFNGYSFGRISGRHESEEEIVDWKIAYDRHVEDFNKLKHEKDAAVEELRKIKAGEIKP